uniref:Uncharacterized protein n=1 Tax=candidate division WOR-3 bacterium TaxID=2052148 RepID=A0A7V1EHV6_UNCW3
MNPKKGRKKQNNGKNKKEKRPYLNMLYDFYWKRSNKQKIILDTFTPEGIPVSSPLNLGIGMTTTDAY